MITKIQLEFPDLCDAKDPAAEREVIFSVIKNILLPECEEKYIDIKWIGGEPEKEFWTTYLCISIYKNIVGSAFGGVIDRLRELEMVKYSNPLT